MLTQWQNPAYRRYRHLLPESGLYPAKWVDIFTNTNEKFEYEEVEVVFIPRGQGAPQLSPNFWDEFAAYNSRWMGDLGNSVAGWMEPGGLNPAKVFGGMLVYGFASRKALDTTILEFAHIQECDWARGLKKGQLRDRLLSSIRDHGAIEEMLEFEANKKPNIWASDMLEAFRDERQM